MLAIFNLFVVLALSNLWLLFVVSADYLAIPKESEDRTIKILALGHVRRKLMRCVILGSVGLGLGHRVIYGTPFHSPGPLLLTVFILLAITLDVVGDIVDRYWLGRLNIS